ncbi:MAG: ABC transporter ATP-binding protein [Eubacterium sp.]|jgi:putative ABC transport system ATP-binding protein|nr:ABC transporter ATP-binding protein [Eubacterium sp.]NBI86250.1 ABC transporter ATP-binding protein [Lachnospiraceae bacterium]
MNTVLQCTGISKTYGNDKIKVHALKKCSLSFTQGEFVAIVGKSGSGKSTLLKILGTLDTPDQGEVLLDNENVLHLPDKKLSQIRRRKIGFIYQDYSLFPEYTAYENIIMPIHLDGRKENQENVLEILKTLGILGCKDKFPSEMSGGEQQRTAIARALVISPTVILADEPTGNLDAENANEVVMLMSKAARLYNQTIIMVTHDRQMADYADRILVISDGVVQ